MLNTIKVLSLSGFEKVFYDGPTSEDELLSGSALVKEKYSFQIAFQGAEKFSINVRTALQSQLNCFVVKQLPSKLPMREGHDEDILRGVPGFYPDLLEPAIPTNIELKGTDRQWHSLWIEFDAMDIKQAGIHNIEIEILAKDVLSDEIKQTVSKNFQLTILPVELSPQKLIHTEWFYSDSLINYYNISVFSEEYWFYVEQFMKMAVEHGQNMILTPVFTPSLDTQVGSERPTVQLVGVEKVRDKYYFNFDKLTQWSELCRKVGFEFLEISHLYTQWGAKFSPKIIVKENGHETQLFGWHTEATSKAYQSFLKEFIPALITWIKENGWEESVYFHTSDEPKMDDLASYKEASVFLKKLVEGYPVIDALSNYDFYQEKLIDIPVPSNDCMADFLENKVSPLWTYYCALQNKKVANRFFDMPSYRNRIIAYQLYKYDIQGFLHWGYNFYFTELAVESVNPFEITDAGGAFPSGDAFLVYPGPEGPLPSIRLKVLAMALQDLRALQMLENKIGREEVLKLIDKNTDKLTFEDYPREANWQIRKREEINSLLKD